MTAACLEPCHATLSFLPALPFQASVDVFLAMGVTTSVAPRVRCFHLFMGQKSEAPQLALPCKLPLRSGEDDTNVVLRASSVVQMPLEPA